MAKRRRRANAVWVLVMLLLITALTVALAYVASRMLMGKPLFDPIQLAAQPNSSAIDDPTLLPPAGTVDPDSPFGAQLPRAWNTMDPLGSTLNHEIVSTDAKMLALPATGKVSRVYFRDALFVGDSLTQGMEAYAEGAHSDGAVIAAFKGTSPKMIVSNATGELQDKRRVPMLDYIKEQKPEKIYVCIGTNALLSDENDAFLKYYGDLLDTLHEIFPEIPLYVQSITPVTAEKALSSPRMDNDRIRLINNSLALMAQERGMYYVNLHEVLADETGSLRDDIATGDGTHMNGEGYGIWVEYLQTHTAYNPKNIQYLEEGQSYSA